MEQQLCQLQVGYRKEKGSYMIDLKTAFDALDVIQELKEHILSFEVLRGNMEDVFLKVTACGCKEGRVVIYE